MSYQLSAAIAFAAHAHRHQIDKRGEPYILHPLRVMNAVREAGYSEAFQMAAVLHDVLEDTYCSSIEMVRLVGGMVGVAVDHLTRRYVSLEGMSYDEFGARKWGDPIETHEEYFQRCVGNEIARVVKYYDLLDNADPKRYAPHVPYKRYLRMLQWYEDNPLRMKVGAQ